MSKILDTNLPVVMGNCIHVVNVEKELNPRLTNEADVFICIQVENEEGKDEYCILLTQDEYDKLKKGTFPNMKDMIPGRIYHKFIVDNNFYCVKLKDPSGEVYVGVFDIGDWSKYFQRALSHPQSCTKKHIITDLFD